MKNILKSLIGILIITSFTACTNQIGKTPKMETNMDSVSYAIGVWLGSGPANVPEKDLINAELLKRGFMDAVSEDTDAEFTQMQAQTILQKWSQDQQAIQMKKDKEDEAGRIQEGKDFLAANKEKPGVIETESGLQYRVIKEGNGKTPLATDKVKVDYTGKLIDGTVFDSSKERGTPAEFNVNQVIPGWTEALQLMKEGSIYELYIPSDLAYGQRAAGDKIKPYSTLIFEVELLEVEDQN